MNPRRSARRLAAAVLALSTVTAVTATLVVAPAAPATAAVTATAETAAPLPVSTEIISAGATGFLTSRQEAGRTVLEWRGLADGSVTLLTAGTVAHDSTSDYAVTSDADGGKVYVRDMRPGADRSAAFDLAREFRPGALLTGAVGAHLFVTVPTDEGFHDLYELDAFPEAGGEARKTRLTTRARGLGFTVAASDGDRVLILGANRLTENLNPRAYWRATAALGGGAAVDGDGARDLGQDGWSGSTGALTADHQAWTTRDADDAYQLVVATSAGERRIPAGPSLGRPLLAGILGQTVVYGAAPNVEMPPDEWFPLYGRDLDPAESSAYPLLEDFSSVTRAPDGSLLARGRSAGAEGLFRISAGGGRPVVTQVARTERGLDVKVVSSSVPTTIDLRTPGGPYPMRWNLNRGAVTVELTLTQLGSGRNLKVRVPRSGVLVSDPYVFEWDGLIGGRPAPGGMYSWRVTATPLDGLGTPATASGQITVRQVPGPHDFDASGHPDVLARDTSGVLWRNDITGGYAPYQRYQVGPGWQAYQHIEAVGNIAGQSFGDVVAVDRSGVLWQYLGKGEHWVFTGRKQVGDGWQVYDKITGGSDLNGDGRADLVATDRTGILWFYAGTGDVTRPFAPRVKVGGGWQVYNRITAVGDIAGATGGDLVARDKDGVLWLYQGNGRGGFVTRVKVGGGWQVFDELVGVGDIDQDGRPDLFATGRYGSAQYLSLGSATRPFARVDSGLYAGEAGKFNGVA
ncbi:VCBS repeat-containing protein [Streptomyces sp. G2]|uniref:FG-GAP repeat domain-containing protein n=1 Tax=Streptomyces sp. G2 TaxID=1684471 RepID=UPI00202E604D|nr:VCBS repeat-containing protein [Streptomyces sp. G2]MCM1943765.1 VCBS repeat-containing protein [Streptomyces sp. G2]